MSSAVSGHKGRERWINAVIATSGLAPITVRVAVRLGNFFNCTTGQCNPGYARLAKEVGVSKRSVFRAIAELEGGGWIAVDRGDGNRDHNHQFTLLMPGERMTAAVTSTGDRIMSPVPTPSRVTKNAGTGDKNRGVRVTHAVTTKEPEEPENLNSAALRAACTTRAVRECATEISTADDAAPPQRAAGAALIKPVAAQQPEAQQQPPSATSIGTGPNGARAAFEDVRFAWPSDRTDDDGYAAYVAALAAAQGDTEVVLDAIWERLKESGADPPWLSDALRRIERDLRYGNPDRQRT
jgi:helix-turn-helix protein